MQHDIMFVHHFSDIDEGVPHPTEGGVDAHAGQAGDFLECHVGIMAEDDDFALLGGQSVDELADAVVRFAANHQCVGGCVGAFDDVKNVKIVRPVRLADEVPPLLPTVIIDTHIVGNPHSPLDKFALVVVFACTKRVDDFDKNFLKNVLRECLVADEQVNLREDFGLVTEEERLKRFLITFEIELDELVVI